MCYRQYDGLFAGRPRNTFWKAIEKVLEGLVIINPKTTLPHGERCVVLRHVQRHVVDAHGLLVLHVGVVLSVAYRRTVVVLENVQF